MALLILKHHKSKLRFFEITNGTKRQALTLVNDKEHEGEPREE